MLIKISFLPVTHKGKLKLDIEQKIYNKTSNFVQRGIYLKKHFIFKTNQAFERRIQPVIRKKINEIMLDAFTT